MPRKKAYQYPKTVNGKYEKTLKTELQIHFLSTDIKNWRQNCNKRIGGKCCKIYFQPLSFRDWNYQNIKDIKKWKHTLTLWLIMERSNFERNSEKWKIYRKYNAAKILLKRPLIKADIKKQRCFAKILRRRYAPRNHFTIWFWQGANAVCRAHKRYGFQKIWLRF